MLMTLGHKNNPTQVEVIYNKFTNVIHVLDLDKGRTVTNSIDDIMPDIHKGLNLVGDYRSYTWYLYGTDGYVSEYTWSTRKFKFVPPIDPLIHAPFQDIMVERSRAV